MNFVISSLLESSRWWLCKPGKTDGNVIVLRWSTSMWGPPLEALRFFTAEQAHAFAGALDLSGYQLDTVKPLAE